MGLSFDLRVVNWLAHVLDERAPIPQFEDEWHQREALNMFLNGLIREERFYSSPWGRRRFHDIVEFAQRTLRSNEQPSQRVLADLREFLGDRPWTALLIPSGRNTDVDRSLCSREFLRDLVEIRPEDPGLILQMDGPPSKIFSLTDVFPAFRTALAASTEWPGILLWTQRGDSIFLTVSSDSASELRREARWIFSHLSTSIGIDLALLKEQYHREFRRKVDAAGSRVTVLHLSDIHLGCREAGLRLPRVQDLLSNLISDLGEFGESVIPLVSGDLMDSPEEDNLDRVRAFLSILGGLGTEKPVVLLGNHDVRKGGILSENLRMAMQIESRSNLVRWFEQYRLGIACFDSVRDGRLARGLVGERQFLDMGSALDAKCRGEHDYLVIAALHHHPIPVELPDWYARPFYERILGNTFEKTDALEDAEAFVDFVEARQVAAVLHGHKHIPRLDATPGGIPVIGCGSSVGKVKTVDGRTFMSINLLTINRSTGMLSARLLAERIAGGGLSQYKSHEVVWTPQPALHYRASA
jgi:hypothetical protein